MFWDLLGVNRRGLINAPAVLSTVSTPLKSKHLCSCFVSNRLVFLFSWKTYEWEFILRWQREVLGHGVLRIPTITAIMSPWEKPTSVPQNMQGWGDGIEVLPLHLQGSGSGTSWKTIPAHFLIWTQKYAHLGFQKTLQLTLPPTQH